jgi:hypothetical protein
VIVLDDKLQASLLKADRQRLLHPEFQAELKWGIEQSTGSSLENLLENLALFFKHGDEWAAVEREIEERKLSLTQSELPHRKELSDGAPLELKYQRALWASDYELALEAAREAISLYTAPSMRGYRALWSYLAGASAHLLAGQGVVRMQEEARDLFRAAGKASDSISWLHGLARFTRQEPENDRDLALPQVIERLEEELERLGPDAGRRYDLLEARIRTGLSQSEAGAFEEAHELLGGLLGYQAGNTNEAAAPDPWWQASDRLCFVFEDYSDASDGTRVGANKVRQATSHDKWIRKRLSLAPDAEVVVVLISPCARAEESARVFASGLMHWSLSEFRDWSSNALAVVRELRRTFVEPGDLVWRSEAISAYTKHRISPAEMKRMLSASPLGAM